jgi:PD-(D/E)XK nuclease superfamily
MKRESGESVADKLRERGYAPEEEKPESLWKGPVVDGVTSSLLGRYLACKERFRIMVIEGLKPNDTFNHRLEYGNMWHVCEQSLSSAPPTRCPDWQSALVDYANMLAKKYPLAVQQIDHWYQTCRVQFPLYIAWWKEHPDTAKRLPLSQEKVFEVGYTLPGGRQVKMRGKRDSVDQYQMVRNGKRRGEIWLQENKTKGEIIPHIMKRQLYFDLQTMFYVVALEEDKDEFVRAGTKVSGVLYNVVRRPFAGGKGSIKRGKPTKKLPRGEPKEEFYGRLKHLIWTAHGPGWDCLPGEHHFFMRWKISLTERDVSRFRVECLDPVLENLLDDYEWWDHCKHLGYSPFDYQIRGKVFSHHRNRHFRFPFGVYNPLADGGESELDAYLATGSEVGLTRVDNLFPELV